MWVHTESQKTEGVSEKRGTCPKKIVQTKKKKCQCLEGKHGIFDGGLWGGWQGLWGGGGGFIAPHVVCVLVVGSTHSANKGRVT